MLRLQEIRMEILKKMLKDREENQANILAKRLDRLWAKKQKEKEKRVKKLRYDHIKGLDLQSYCLIYQVIFLNVLSLY